MGLAAPEPTPIRDAASLILVRSGPAGPLLLMGQRGASAVFMPSKYVFPGGAVDGADAQVPLARQLPAEAARLLADRSKVTPQALAVAAIRELWEEAGLALGARDSAVPDWPNWPTGLAPDPSALSVIFRAITPPGRPRRFDARFFMVDAAHLRCDLDDFTHATDELSHLHWVPLAQARRLDLPFITEVVLGEVAARLAGSPRPGAPFFENGASSPQFSYLGA